jgi:hypothetical protein
MAAFLRCMACGHTDDHSSFGKIELVCPNCHTPLEHLPGEMTQMSIPLCTLRGGNVSHVWRFIAPIANSGLWQCDNCKAVVQGRLLNDDELSLKREKKELPPVLSVDVPS